MRSSIAGRVRSFRVPTMGLMFLLPMVAFPRPEAFRQGNPLPSDGIEVSHPVDQTCDLRSSETEASPGSKSA